jgi:diacylglycerol kinase (ATP)
MNLVVLNPNARGGRARRIWHRLGPVLWEHFDDPVIAVTRSADEVGAHIDDARRAGVERIIVIGGDGTNHAIVNALLQEPARADVQPIPIGQVPIGTGHDWSRTLSIPTEPVEAIRWLAQAEPRPCDVGRVTFRGRSRLFLNVASAGVGAEVARRVNAVQNRKPWTYLRAILTVLMSCPPQWVRVTLDGRLFYEGTSYVTVVANGRWFGHGIMVAPNAAYDDGLFDVLLAEGMSRPRIIHVLMQAYGGNHLSMPGVHSGQAARVEIEAARGETLGLELDGEPDEGEHLTFEVLPSALQVLVRQGEARQM